MKVVKSLAKVAIALAAVAGVVYVVATYGSQIVAWCKKLLASLPCCKCDCDCDCTCEEETTCVEAEAEVREEADNTSVDVVPEDVPAEVEEADFEN